MSQVAVSGILAHAETVGTSTDYPVQINLADCFDRDPPQLGKVGTATVVANNGGPIGVVADILLWVCICGLSLNCSLLAH